MQNTGTFTNVGYLQNLGDVNVITGGRFLSGGQDLFTIFSSVNSGELAIGYYAPSFYSFNTDGTSLAYNLPYTVYNGTEPNGYLITVTGTVQRPGIDFSVTAGVPDGGVITFTSPPPANGNVGVYTYRTARNFVQSVSSNDLVVTNSIQLSQSLVSTFSVPVTASGDFLTVKIGTKNRLIRMWDF